MKGGVEDECLADAGQPDGRRSLGDVPPVEFGFAPAQRLHHLAPTALRRLERG